MATAGELVRGGILIAVDPEDLLGRGGQPFRRIFLLPRVERWIESTLDGLEPDGFYHGASRPMEQLYDHFRDFVAGVNIANAEWYPKRIDPVEQLVWELRTPDLRVFGWFWRRGTFIVSAIDRKSNIINFGLYGPYRNQCVTDYQALDLDPPPAIEGDEQDVL